MKIHMDDSNCHSTRIALRIPCLGIHFSPARYHRLLQVAKIFQEDDSSNKALVHPWNQSDFEGWVSVLVWKGMGNREAVWQSRYLCLVGSFLYVLENPNSNSYKQCISLRAKQIHEVPLALVGGVEHLLAVSDAAQFSNKVFENVNTLILQCNSEESKSAWRSRLQGSIYHASGSAPVIDLSESSTDQDITQTEFDDTGGKGGIENVQKIFIFGALDELKMFFCYNSQFDRKFTTALLSKENPLFEFRAIGGQVEFSMRENDMLIDAVLNSLEIDDLVCKKREHEPCYLARSVIQSTAEIYSDNNDGTVDIFSDLNEKTGDEEFYEAAENLYDCTLQSSGDTSDNSDLQQLLLSEMLATKKSPSFDGVLSLSEDDKLAQNSDNFVRGQIVICDPNSPFYDNTDTRVMITLSSLSFYCRRPTIVAIVEFINAINISDESDVYFSKGNTFPADRKTPPTATPSSSLHSLVSEEPVIRGLLGKGKSRKILYLTLNMARACILLMKENETKLATLSQENLMTDIEVYPSSFRIKADLGNLRISDDSLVASHPYYWICDMRNPGSSSFVKLDFSSFNVEDDDYEGYDYSLSGHLSEVRIIYLNRFVQEVAAYFTGIVPDNSTSTVKLKDQITNTEKWFTVNEIEGSPAVKLDISLRKPIILLPRRTDSLEYLKLDVVHITLNNTFQWINGSRDDLNAAHVDILTVLIEDINLNVGTGIYLGESIIKDVKGVSVVVRRSLRDLLHQIPSVEVAVQVVELKAALSSREYGIIIECASSNIAEVPNHITPLDRGITLQGDDLFSRMNSQSPGSIDLEKQTKNTWVELTVSVVINLIELRLHSGITSDATLASVQATGAWLFYRSNVDGEGNLSATLSGFTVVDDREGVEKEFRMAIRTPDNIAWGSVTDTLTIATSGPISINDNSSNINPSPTMIIVDVKFTQMSTSVSLFVQRPQLLVALDFLLAVAEFFVPSVGNLQWNGGDENSLSVDEALIFDQETLIQPASEFSISPKKPLVVDDERFTTFVYDGNGGTLDLCDRKGLSLCSPSLEPVIFVGNGKQLQFRNVVVKNGQYLDSCILLGENSSYSASGDDRVYLPGNDAAPHVLTKCFKDQPTEENTDTKLSEFIVNIQAIGPELTFYNTSRNVSNSPMLSNRLLHAQLDAFCRIVLKGDTAHMNTDVLGLTMESNGVRILEPLDASMKFDNASGKTNLHLDVSDVFFNFPFSILKLFLAVEEDLLAFIRTSSKQMTVVCSQFDKIGTIGNEDNDRIYAFWRARSPPGFVILGDYLTPLDKPPTKGIFAINTNFVRLKRPVSFKLIWSQGDYVGPENSGFLKFGRKHYKDVGNCSIWFPEAPDHYVAMGCVVSQGLTPPPLSSTFCILASLVSPCGLRDCVAISSLLAFWRVNNSLGTFLPADTSGLGVKGKPYELRHVLFQQTNVLPDISKSSNFKAPTAAPPQQQLIVPSSNPSLEASPTFKLIWWNQGSSSQNKLSIWRPVVPSGMVYFGDIAIQGYEPPSGCTILNDGENDDILKAPVDFQMVGKVKKSKGVDGISFWVPQAPPGYTALGCLACKGTPVKYDYSSLRCVRGDMVTGDRFLEGKIWDTSDAKITTDPFSLWAVANDLRTFVVRSGFKKPPRRLALRLADTNTCVDSIDLSIEAKIRTFSTALYDDYGGLMVPLFNISVSGIGFSMCKKIGYMNSRVKFSIAARSYNDKFEAWEPILEPVDGFLRYGYDPHNPSQFRLTSTGNLNLNLSVSNANMMIQAYGSWNNLGHAHESYKKQEYVPPSYSGSYLQDVHHKNDFFIIPQNKLGQDIFVSVLEPGGLQEIVRMPFGDVKPVKVPVLKNMLQSHLKGEFFRKSRGLVTVLIADAEFPRVEEMISYQYTVTISVTLKDDVFDESLPHKQSARTCGRSADLLASGSQLVTWNEIFFFKVDSPDHYLFEMTVVGIGKDDRVGYFSAPLDHVMKSVEETSHTLNLANELVWMDLSTVESMGLENITRGRIRCAIILSGGQQNEKDEKSIFSGVNSSLIRISPAKEGPWATVGLNYAAAATCWRFGNDIIASQVTVSNGNRYVNIRSLVSVFNSTDIVLDLRLKSKTISENLKLVDESNDHQTTDTISEIEEFFETEKYDQAVGWVGYPVKPCENFLEGGSLLNHVIPHADLPPGWVWTDEWSVDKCPPDSNNSADDGWVYSPNLECLNRPESYLNPVRRRKWTRTRKRTPGFIPPHLSIGRLKPGDTVSVPLFGLMQPEIYTLQLRPSDHTSLGEYSWSSTAGIPPDSNDISEKSENLELCVSALDECEKLVCCTRISKGSCCSTGGLWFCLSVQGTEISKDIRSNLIRDWNIVVKPPLSLASFLPMEAEFAVLEMRDKDNFTARTRGVLFPGMDLKVHDADIRSPLYFSLLPQHGWLPIHEAVLISHPQKDPARTLSLRNSITGRIVQIIIEHHEQDKQRPLLPKSVRIYSPYWFSMPKSPSLTCRLLGFEAKKARKAFSFLSKTNEDAVLFEISDEETQGGYTIASALNFKCIGLSISLLDASGTGQFSPPKDLTPLGDMDGSLDINAYDVDGKCVRLFISSKPCLYQSVPTKIILVRPYMTFTNRIGQDLFIRLNNQDEPKVLRAFDSRASFKYLEIPEEDELQVRLEGTEWSYPVHIVKEDTIFLSLKDSNGGKRVYLKTEIRGFEEGSRFIIVFRLGATTAPIRLENRTNKSIRFRQCGFGENDWLEFGRLSSINFSWDDPYGEKLIDVEVDRGDGEKSEMKFDLEKMGLQSKEIDEMWFHLQVMYVGDTKVGTFRKARKSESGSGEEDDCGVKKKASGNWELSSFGNKVETGVQPLEIIVELGVVGISVVDHEPKELCYLYLERVYTSYSAGYDYGTTNRFKLICGYLQLDNQLPLTVMPRLLAPDHGRDTGRPVLKMTITMRNDNVDGILVLPYVYVSVTDKLWRLNIHEPIIWALVDFYNNLRLDHLPKSSTVTQVDPELRIDLIYVSEIRLRVSLETAPAQRPHGVLGVWGPILSAIGNAFKIQVHLRKVMRRDRFMRQSSITGAITNRVWRDLVHNPLHLIFSLDVLGMTSSTFASLSKGFAELSTDGQFLQLRSKQVSSRRITGVGDGIVRGTEALAQGLAFGVSGMVTKPVESARQNGLLGLAHGLGRAFLGFIAQPVSGALDFVSLTVDGIGASCSRCLEVFNTRSSFLRARNPRVMHSGHLLADYSERRAVGQMILYLAEASRHFGCTEIFKEPSKFALSDNYEDHFVVPYQRIVLVTNKRVMLLQCMDLDNLDKKACKIMWDVPWEELMSIEVADAGSERPSHLILHIKTFRKSGFFARIIKCSADGESDGGSQAARICSVARRVWKAFQSYMKCVVLRVPEKQKRVFFAWGDDRMLHSCNRSSVRSRSRSLLSPDSPDGRSRSVKHTINFQKIWSSEQESRNRCTLCRRQVWESSRICSIWRPICPDGYVSVGDIARVGVHPPNVAAVYRCTDKMFALSLGYDLVWRNCEEDYVTPVSIWLPRPPDGFVALGCVAVAGFDEPTPDVGHCVAESMTENTTFEGEEVWAAPRPYPWACHIYQVQSDALHFMALRHPYESSRAVAAGAAAGSPLRVVDSDHLRQCS